VSAVAAVVELHTAPVTGAVERSPLLHRGSVRADQARAGSSQSAEEDAVMRRSAMSGPEIATLLLTDRGDGRGRARGPRRT
jgi:hypothetical protein